MIDEKKYDLFNKILDGEAIEELDKNLEYEVEKYKIYVKAYFESYAIIDKCKETIISKVIMNLDMEE
ncbi:hypothetical protein [Marinitoga litoralis]|jgi:hypothetical protein|uniref:hypothetical protein n=1 Tax=Marinitoga litoralis TaxID=570855 RepID=UPI001960B302|nr:hypothetical protein [Marinitoga litoralis]MBM7559806.1 hypothetical protein [Marinitoga litoralis]